MAIAANLKKYAQALALQLPLPLGPLRMLKQARPTTRAARLARSARRWIRAAALKVKVMYPPKKVPYRKPTPIDPNSTMLQLPMWIEIALYAAPEPSQWAAAKGDPFTYHLF
jgi:hypothetical protein